MVFVQYQHVCFACRISITHKALVADLLGLYIPVRESIAVNECIIESIGGVWPTGCSLHAMPQHWVAGVGSVPAYAGASGVKAFHIGRLPQCVTPRLAVSVRFCLMLERSMSCIDQCSKYVLSKEPFIVNLRSRQIKVSFCLSSGECPNWNDDRLWSRYKQFGSKPHKKK